MTLDDYRLQLGWSLAELARRTGVDVSTIRRAIEGQQIYKHTASSIANALSQGLGYKISYHDIDGLNVRD